MGRVKYLHIKNEIYSPIILLNFTLSQQWIFLEYFVYLSIIKHIVNIIS